MVEVTYQPLKQVLVYERVKHRSVEALARAVAIESGGMQSPYLCWNDGVAFKLSPPPIFTMSETFAKEFLDGKLHVSVDYAVMPQYKATVNAAEEKVIIPILDDSPSPLAKQVVAWIRSQGEP